MAKRTYGQNQVPLTIFQGCKFERVFRSRLEDGSYRDFTGVTATCHFVPANGSGDSVEASVTVTTSEGHSALRLVVVASDTQDMEEKPYRWNIKIIPSGGDDDDAEYLVGGIATVVVETTP